MLKEGIDVLNIQQTNDRPIVFGMQDGCRQQYRPKYSADNSWIDTLLGKPKNPKQVIMFRNIVGGNWKRFAILDKLDPFQQNLDLQLCLI